MEDYIKEKIEELRKSMYKKVEKLNKKGVIEDLNDSNMIAESKDDEDDTKSGSIVNKNSEKHDCDCEDQDDCECDEVKKAEAFVRDIVKNFKTISEQYLAKARSEEGMPASAKRAMRQARNKNLKPKKRERSDLDRTKRKLVEEPKAREKNIERIKNKQRKLKPKETAEIRGFEEEKLAASEKEKARIVSQEEKNFLSGVKRGKKDWEGIKENSPPPVPKEKEKLAASEKRKS